MYAERRDTMLSARITARDFRWLQREAKRRRVSQATIIMEMIEERRGNKRGAVKA